jgi:NAD(P)-dependent dehydrogenase (short-subunit alcohol dehydrogenase family)
VHESSQLPQVNNAGAGGGEGIFHDSQEQFDTIFHTNVRGLYFTAQSVAKLMVDHNIKGRIVNTSSIAGGEVIQPLHGVYAASKAAVIQLTRWVPKVGVCTSWQFYRVWRCKV